jgi:hypothetical protein
MLHIVDRHLLNINMLNLLHVVQRQNYKRKKGIWEGILYTQRKKQISKLSIDLTPSRPMEIGVVNVNQQGFLNCPHMGRSHPHCLVPWTFWIKMIDYALSGDILYGHNITHQHL